MEPFIDQLKGYFDTCLSTVNGHIVGNYKFNDIDNNLHVYTEEDSSYDFKYNQLFNAKRGGNRLTVDDGFDGEPIEFYTKALIFTSKE